jgi:A/G-specific adenine glycosylase
MARTLRGRLLAWYTRTRRDLPWRRTRDPYAIWVSEAMLQQTRVETVIPYYERFLEAFPDVAGLASADLEDVLGHWAGLGYYSRARNLKRAAEAVLEHHGGVLPDDVKALQTLPGIGRYTAGAIASIAFDRPAPIVDGNVARVLCRVHAIEGAPAERSVRMRLWEEAETLAQGPRPGDLNQALMELGARLCTPRSPRCGACPIRANCRARREGRVEEIPRAAPNKAPRKETWVAALLLRRGRALAVRTPEGGRLGGLWELPGGAVSAHSRGNKAARSKIEQRVGLAPSSLRRVGRFEYDFTHRHLEVHVFRGELAAGRTRLDGYDAHRWVAPSRLASLPAATLTHRVLEIALSKGSKGARDPGRWRQKARGVS